MNLIARALASLALVVSASALADCPPDGWPQGRMDDLKAAGFALADDAERPRLALALVDCLGDPDPAVRDGIAYEALAAWLRGEGLLDTETRRALMGQLLPRLSGNVGDGFEAPFAALALSEVARTDRISPWMAAVEREALVQAAAGYVQGLRDYRGFTDGQGWRHGVAHGADLLMQLAMNPALDKSQLSRLMAAAASQVAPVGAPPYVHGESERLVRPVLFVLRRGLHDETEWADWVSRLVVPAPLADWGEAYRSEAGLARRHNLRGFLLALYVGLDASGSEALQAHVPAVVAGLRALP